MERNLVNNARLPRMIPAAMVALVVTMSGCSAGSTSAGSPSSHGVPSPSVSTTGEWPVDCGKVADPPKSGQVWAKYDDPKAKVDDGSMVLEFYLANSTKLIAVDIDFTIQVSRDGKDVSAQLGDEFEGWRDSDASSVSPDAELSIGQNWEIPKGLSDGPLDMKVTVDKVHKWCHPKKKKD